MTAIRKRKLLKTQSYIRNTRHGGREYPEDIMSDSGLLFKEYVPFYKWKRFNFVIGITVGLLGMYAASTTPVAQNSLNTIQDYLLLQLGDIDLAHILPQSDMVDEFLGNFTNFIKPTPPTEMSFMPALEFQ
jgi:phospholipid:diacylglycerol acyltransferase